MSVEAQTPLYSFSEIKSIVRHGRDIKERAKEIYLGGGRGKVLEGILLCTIKQLKESRRLS